MARQLKQEPDAAKRIASFVDQDLVARLAKADPEQMEADAEKQLETAANEYADVALGRTTVGELARGELFELRYLSIGKAAPEIEGEDLDGKPFKLSDYRGKVVVLDFWGNWRGLRAMYPHERSLVKRTEGKPFALLGINSDADKDALKKVLVKEEITWRSWWNGPKGTSGPLSEKWNVNSWPTTYVLDAKGVIRYKNVRGEKMDEAVDALLKEVDVGAK